MWPEVKTAIEEKRHEIVLTGSSVNERLAKEGLDETLFELINLNYLNIHESNLNVVPNSISKLINLQTLVLHSNKLNSINSVFSELEKLKVLDLSFNSLQEIPQVFDKLQQIVTINLSGNCLKSFPPLLNNSKLSVLNISNNKLATFPDICHSELCNLSELKLNGNEIVSIPGNISELTSLKHFDVSSNKIKTVPGELADCGKLKELNLKQNPITDRRLFKLIDQCRSKQVLDYVKQHCPKTKLNDVPSGKKGKKAEKGDSEKPGNVEKEYKYSIKIQYAKDDFSVVIMKNVKSIREHFVGCIVHDVVFTEETFKKFIQIQNKLHDTLCDKRNAATIATHDFKKFPPGNLTYTTRKPEELQIKPLNRTNMMTGEELFRRLQVEAQNLRKEKKRNTYSGIHKFLYLIEGQPEYPCILNADLAVISFPPITNSDISKVDLNTSTIFIEVTSSLTQNVCRKILDSILKEMVILFEKDLLVEQVKTTDLEGNMKTVYPSKVDLHYEDNVSIKIIRDN